MCFSKTIYTAVKKLSFPRLAAHKQMHVPVLTGQFRTLDPNLGSTPTMGGAAKITGGPQVYLL